MSTWGKSSPESPSDEPQPLTLERVGGGQRAFSGRVLAVALILVSGVGLLVAKPWTSWQPAPHPTLAPTHIAAVPTPTPSATALPTIDPLVLAVQRRQCQSPTQWRIVTAETTAMRETRTMYAASPQEVSGPTDPSIAISHLYAGSMRAVGVCVPRSDDAQIVAELSRVSLWQLNADGVAERVIGAEVIDWPLYRVGEAYWAPPADEGQTWPPGTYLFEIVPMNDGASTWMGVQFVLTGGAVGALLL